MAARGNVKLEKLINELALHATLDACSDKDSERINGARYVLGTYWRVGTWEEHPNNTYFTDN